MHSVEQHFAKSSPDVRAIYDRILTAANKWGSVEEDPKKTSIRYERIDAGRKPHERFSARLCKTSSRSAEIFVNRGFSRMKAKSVSWSSHSLWCQPRLIAPSR